MDLKKPLLRWWRTSWPWEVFAGICAAALSLPLLSRDFFLDQGIFAAVADKMLHGGVAYRDAWEARPPGVFLVYWAAFLTLGREIWAVRCFEIFALAIAAAGLVRLLSCHFGTRIGGIVAALLMPLVYLKFSPSTAQPESFQIPFIIWAMALWPRPDDDSPSASRFFFVGILLSLILLFKTPAVFFVSLFILDRLWSDHSRKGWASKTRATAIIVAGMSVLPTGMIAYYTCRGSFVPMWDALFVFPRLYAGLTIRLPASFHLERFWRWTTWMLSWPERALILFGVGRALWLRRDDAIRWILMLLGIWVIPVIQAKYWDYHHLPLVPMASIGLGMAFASAGPGPNALPLARRRLELAGTALATILTIWSATLQYSSGTASWASLARPATIEHVLRPEANQWAAARPLAKEIQTLAGPEESIFVWGDDGLIYYLSDRRVAGPYPQLIHILLEQAHPGHVYRLVERLEKERPRLIIVCHESLWWHDYDEAEGVLHRFPDMELLLRERYRFLSTSFRHDLWIRRD